MDNKDSIWSRRNNTSNLSLSTPGAQPNDSRDYSSLSRRTGSGASTTSQPRGPNPFGANAPNITSPGAAPAANQFGLGSGAFGFAGTGKTPKSTGNPFEGSFAGIKTPASEKSSKDALRAAAMGKPSMGAISELGAPLLKHSLNDSWIFWFRPPISKANGYVEYEKSVHAIAEISAVEEFWAVYRHLKRPSALPEKSDYHLFKKGIRPIWEDEENKLGGKWILHVKKGVADRLWEDVLLACIGDQLGEENDEICGVVLSVRNSEDTLSIWTRHDGQRNNKIRDCLRRSLSYPSPLNFVYKSHNESRAKAAHSHHHNDNHANKRTPHHNKNTRQPQQQQEEQRA